MFWFITAFVFCLSSVVSSVLFVLVGLLFLQVHGLLLVQGTVGGVPGLLQVEVGFQLQHLVVVIHFFGLKLGLVVARVPLSVVVGVVDEACAVLAGRQVVEVGVAIDYGHGAHHGVLLVQQFDEGRGGRSRDVEQDGAVFFNGLHLELVLYLVRKQAVQAVYGHGVYGELVALAGRPVGVDVVELQVQGVAVEVVGDVLPQGVDLQLQVDGGGVDACQRFLEGEGDVVVHVHGRRGVDFYREELGGQDRLGGFNLVALGVALLFLLGLFAEFFQLLLVRLGLLLHQFLVADLRLQAHGVDALHQLAQCVRLHIGQLRTQRVLLVEQGVFYPIVYGVVASRGLLDDEGVALVEVQSAQQGERIGGCREVEAELLRSQPLGLGQALVEVYLLEAAQQDVVRQVVRVLTLHDGVDGQGVNPGRVLAHAEFITGDYERVVPGNLLHGLGEVDILVGVLQGVDAVTARRHAPDGEASPAVGAPHTLEGHRGESRIGQVGVEAYQHSLHRLQVRSVQHRAGYGHRVQPVARGEGEGEQFQRIALVVVLYGVAKVDGVRRVGLQRVVQVDDDPLAAGANLRLLYLRRGYDHLLVGLVQLDVFIEGDGDAVAVVVQLPRRGTALYEHGRVFVYRSTLNAAYAGTRIKQHAQHNGHRQTLYKQGVMFHPKDCLLENVHAICKL